MSAQRLHLIWSGSGGEQAGGKLRGAAGFGCLGSSESK